MAQTKQVKAVVPLNNGFVGGTFNSGDGVDLFSLVHPTIAGTVANTLAVAADLKRNFIRTSID